MANTKSSKISDKKDKVQKNPEVTNKDAKIEPPIVEAPAQTQAVANENELLKQQLAEMKAQMELMAQMVSQKPTENKSGVVKDRNITFVNLTNGKAVLKGSAYWEIDGRFATRTFLEREARIIVNNMPNMIRSGGVYITDAQFVEDNDLSEIYMNLLSDKDLKELLNQNAAYVIDVYKTASEGQQQVIVDMIIDEKLKGKQIDNNILVELGKLCGKDLINIEE